MTSRRRGSGRVARRASAIGASLLMALGGLVAAAPTAPAAPGAAGAAAATQAVAVTVGLRHSCALTAAGGVKCWGDNYYGQLGDGTRTDRLRPVDVVGLTSGVAQISASPQGNTTCVVTTAGGVKCWGEGGVGELGTGGPSRSSVPVDVVGLTSGAASVSVGFSVVCALTVTGGAKCWGYYPDGGLGDGGSSSYGPVDVAGMGSGVRAVSASIDGACALTADGVSCWGYNGYGTLGNGEYGSNRYTPVPVLRLGSDVTSVDGGSAGKCATTAGGRLFCWGNNASGLLGVGSSNPRVTAPLPVRGLNGITAVSAGDLVTCALQAHRTWCWGNNRDGAVGDGTTTDRTSPVQVVGLPGLTVGIAAGVFHTCAVSSLGRVSCWGADAEGQLGNGTRTGSPVPVRVSGFAAG